MKLVEVKEGIAQMLAYIYLNKITPRQIGLFHPYQLLISPRLAL